jgi:putative membrane protein
VSKVMWVGLFIAVLIWSAIGPKDMFTWFLEVLPAMVGFVVLLLTYQTFPLTNLAYCLILVHCIILMVGGHYTYAEVPLFDSLSDWLGSSRNNYDKLGHFAQGFIPAIIGREVILRKHVVTGAKWQAFFVVCFCLAFSAFYELIEWWVALASGDSADAFLGAQGYIWDTQSDMGFALIGAILALLSLSKVHDRQLAVLIKKAG